MTCKIIVHYYSGEIQYRQRLEDIRLLKLEIKKLRREKGILTKNVANIEDLRYIDLTVVKELWFFVQFSKTCVIVFQTWSVSHTTRVAAWKNAVQGFGRRAREPHEYPSVEEVRGPISFYEITNKFRWNGCLYMKKPRWIRVIMCCLIRLQLQFQKVLQVVKHLFFWCFTHSGQWSKYVWNDTKDTNFTEKTHSEDRRGTGFTFTIFLIWKNQSTTDSPRQNFLLQYT